LWVVVFEVVLVFLKMTARRSRKKAYQGSQKGQNTRQKKNKNVDNCFRNMSQEAWGLPAAAGKLEGRLECKDFPI
jgi:hypothetical protein